MKPTPPKSKPAKAVKARKLPLQERIRRLFTGIEKRQAYQQEYSTLVFTEELYRCMEGRGLTKSTFAKNLGVSRAYMSKVFWGQNFSIATMTKLALALGCRVRITLEPVRPLVAPRDGKKGAK